MGGTLLAGGGAASPRRAMVEYGAWAVRRAGRFVHTENGRDQMIAEGMGRLAEAALKEEDPRGSGT